MRLHHVPLLGIQRDLHGIPRGMERFRQYLRMLQNADGTGLELPSLVFMNPMGKEHVAALLDELISMDAEGVAARAVSEAAALLAGDPGDFEVGLVVADDLKGTWTNRFDWEFALRFPEGSASPAESRLPKWLGRSWLTAVIWTSEPASERAVREAVLTAIHRAAHLRLHGCARTLREKLAQEGAVMSRAGCAGPVLDADEIAYTREVLAPFLGVEDKRATIEFLFGDEAARTLGFTPRGLGPLAGLALALHDARRASAGAAEALRPERYRG